MSSIATSKPTGEPRVLTCLYSIAPSRHSLGNDGLASVSMYVLPNFILSVAAKCRLPWACQSRDGGIASKRKREGSEGQLTPSSLKHDQATPAPFLFRFEVLVGPRPSAPDPAFNSKIR